VLERRHKCGRERHLALFLTNTRPATTSLPLLSHSHLIIASFGPLACLAVIPSCSYCSLAGCSRFHSDAHARCCSRVYSYRHRFLHWLSVGDKTASLQRYAASATGLGLSSWATVSCVTYSLDCQFTSKHSTATHSLVPAYYIGPHLAQHSLHDSISLSTCDVC
jgi:hypothetical protein